MNKPLCLIVAPVGTSSGYGARSRDLVTALLKLDKYDIKIFPTPWGATPNNALTDTDPNHIAISNLIMREPNLPRQPDLYIQVTVPNEFQPQGKYDIVS